jgi:hypothetical protein
MESLFKERNCDHCGEVPNKGGAHYPGLDAKWKFACWKDECQAHAKAERSEVDNAEIASLRSRGLCIFELVYIGYCGEKGVVTWKNGQQIERTAPVKVVSGTDFCDVHLGEKCANGGCGKQAVGQCSSAGSLVCGAPYCRVCGSHKRCYP